MRSLLVLFLLFVTQHEDRSDDLRFELSQLYLNSFASEFEAWNLELMGYRGSALRRFAEERSRVMALQRQQQNLMRSLGGSGQLQSDQQKDRFVERCHEQWDKLDAQLLEFFRQNTAEARQLRIARHQVKHDGARTIHIPPLADALQLSDDQRQKVRAFRIDAARRILKFSAKSENTERQKDRFAEQVEDGTWVRVMAVLKEDQLRRYLAYQFQYKFYPELAWFLERRPDKSRDHWLRLPLMKRAWLSER